jgi:hypothetical protein
VTTLSPNPPSSVVGLKMNNRRESDSGEQAELSEPIMSAIAAEDTTAETAEPQHTAATSYLQESSKRERRSFR